MKRPSVDCTSSNLHGEKRERREEREVKEEKGVEKKRRRRGESRSRWEGICM